MGYSSWGHKESDTTERFHLDFRLRIQKDCVLYLDSHKNRRTWCLETTGLPLHNGGNSSYSLRVERDDLRMAFS